MFSIQRGSDNWKKLKSNKKRQSKNIRFEEYCNCLIGENIKNECHKFAIPSIVLEMFLQKVHKTALSPSDEKQ